MTREEEMKLANKLLKNSLFGNYGEAFIAGVEWADEHSTWLNKYHNGFLWIDVNDYSPCDFDDLIENNAYTKNVLVVTEDVETHYRSIKIANMRKFVGSLELSDWSFESIPYCKVLYWTFLPELPC